MKGRETVKGAPSADLLVCFPSRARLTLLPKPICSPARPAEATKRYRHIHHHQRLKKTTTRGCGGGGGGGGQASPLLWAKNKQMGSEIAEPTSPKVTCAGQIKVRHKATACKSWQSVMEEIERIHNSRKNKKKSSWIDSLGFKKDIMQFLTCLRNIRFDFRCFGSIPKSEITTDDDEKDEEEEYQENRGGSDANEASRTMFSKWFMVLQENQNSEFCQEKRRYEKEKDKSFFDHESIASPSVPPPNALLLMRCRSAPAKSWLEEKEEPEEEEEEEEEDESRKTEEEKKGKNLKALIEEEKRNTKNDLDSLVVMRYEADFYKISSDIAKETWVVGGMKDPLSRSRSWKR